MDQLSKANLAHISAKKAMEKTQSALLKSHLAAEEYYKMMKESLLTYSSAVRNLPPPPVPMLYYGDRWTPKLP